MAGDGKQQLRTYWLHSEQPAGDMRQAANGVLIYFNYDRPRKRYRNRYIHLAGMFLQKSRLILNSRVHLIVDCLIYRRPNVCLGQFTLTAHSNE